MSIKHTIPKPAGWTGLESLMLRLFSVKHNNEFVRHSHNGQAQQGVDIYGLIKQEGGYYGIQCKSKDAHDDKKLTISEIDAIINAALEFEPALKHFFIATTSSKDSKLEKHIRIKNVEHLNKGLFPVTLLCWEDIEELLHAYKEVLDWYLSGTSIGVNSVAICFSNDLLQVDCKPIFERVEYTLSTDPDAQPFKESYALHEDQNIPLPKFLNFCKNHSFCSFRIKIVNTGSGTLSNYTVRLQFPGDTILSESNTSGGLLAYGNGTPTKNYTIIYAEKAVSIRPPNPVLVSGDSFITDDIYFKPHHEQTSLELGWIFLSDSHKQSGILSIVLNTVITPINRKVNIDPSRITPGEFIIEDHCTGH